VLSAVLGGSLIKQTENSLG